MVKVVDESAVLKSLEGLSDEQKIAKLIGKLVESEKQVVDLKAKIPQIDKVSKQRDALEKKLEKANQILLRTEESKNKLEELCRGLQKLNQQIREENNAKIKKLETERQEAVIQLKTTLKDIENSMTVGKEKSDSLAEDNRKLAEKFAELGQQYEERLKCVEEQYDRKGKYWEEFAKTKEVEIKLLTAKLEASNITGQKLVLEKQELAKTVIEETARVGGAIETEKHLRDQVKQYAEKYSELSSCLAKSNTAFDKFRKEIDRVNTNCRKVEVDVAQWRKKCDEANQKVLVLTMTNQEFTEKFATQNKKIEKLENLCRALRSGTAQEAASTTSE